LTLYRDKRQNPAIEKTPFQNRPIFWTNPPPSLLKKWKNSSKWRQVLYCLSGIWDNNRELSSFDSEGAITGLAGSSSPGRADSLKAFRYGLLLWLYFRKA
jgi:hypothetical protein